MKEKIEEMVKYIQERCLWQFFSRSWDRDENIEGILTKTGEILTGESSVVETQADKCWFADAKILASDFKSNLKWVKTDSKEDLQKVIAGVKLRMKEIAVDKSRNEELHAKNY
jgi:vanadium nitrogenase delta subunit